MRNLVIKLLGFRLKRKKSIRLVKPKINMTILALIISVSISATIAQHDAPYSTPTQFTFNELSGKNKLSNQLLAISKEKEQLEIENKILRRPAVTDDGLSLSKEKVITSINTKLKGKLVNKGEVFYTAGKSRNVNPMLMAAISIHETANGKSKVLAECNNVAGINWTGNKNIPKKGRYAVFKDVDDSIYNLAYILDNNYIKQNRTTIETIGAKFCPLNDKDNGKWGMENSSWVPSVTLKYIEILDEIRGGKA